jgi:hypothetical protein
VKILTTWNIVSRLIPSFTPQSYTPLLLFLPRWPAFTSLVSRGAGRYLSLSCSCRLLMHRLTTSRPEASDALKGPKGNPRQWVEPPFMDSCVPSSFACPGIWSSHAFASPRRRSCASRDSSILWYMWIRSQFNGARPSQRQYGRKSLP